MAGKVRIDPVTRFWKSVEFCGPMPDPENTLCPNTPCWIWNGSMDPHGYGRFWVKGRHIGAHIYAFELVNGPVPDGKELDHLCRRPRCINPNHQEPVTHLENVRRGIAAQVTRQRSIARTHCSRGHALSGSNLVIAKSGGRIWRRCRTCQNRKNKKWMRGHHERRRLGLR